MSESTSSHVSSAAASSSGKPKRGVILKTPIPGPKAKKIIARDARVLMTSTKTSPIVAESGEGVWVTDVDGNRLLDFASGVAVQAVGYPIPMSFGPYGSRSAS